MIKYMPLQGLFELEMFDGMARNPTTKEGCASKRYENELRNLLIKSDLPSANECGL